MENLFSDEFANFVNASTNQQRFEIICERLKSIDAKFKIITNQNLRHILVGFDSKFYNPQFRNKLIVCHYDRVPGTPGANDNSSAVWQVLEFIEQLVRWPVFHNVKILFTDGEELGEHGVTEQGSYYVAKNFESLGLKKYDVFVFDCTGRGDVAVMGKTILPKTISDKIKKQFNQLFENTKLLLKNAADNKWMTLPITLSDNASFLASGIPCVAITFLPMEEATLYARDILIKQFSADEENFKPSTFAKMKEQIYIPKTWQLFHTPQDNLQSLTPQSFMLMKSILEKLANLRTID